MLMVKVTMMIMKTIMIMVTLMIMIMDRDRDHAIAHERA